MKLKYFEKYFGNDYKIDRMERYSKGIIRKYSES